MAEIVKIDPNNFQLQLYESQDETLISSFDIDTFLTQSGYIEFYIYDLNNNILTQNLNYSFYSIEDDGQSAGNNNRISKFNISPDNDVSNFGFDEGEFIAYYNFLYNQIGNLNDNFYISEISSDRTEIRLDSNI